MTCLGVLKRGERGKDNVTGLKEGGGIQILTTVLHSRCSLLRLNTHLRLFFFELVQILNHVDVARRNVFLFLSVSTQVVWRKVPELLDQYVALLV